MPTRQPALPYLPRRAALRCHPAARLVLLALLCMALPTQAADPLSADLASMSLEELANTRITSVSRRAESLADAPASIYVISADSIRRSGAETLPEALRLAPNLQVARADGRNYAITARGLNNTLENKLLVQIDGRSVYSPLFSGVFWDAQDLDFDDIERIEVISGPGSTMWGANAVNAVINIITKSAAQTQGQQFAVSTDLSQQAVSARHGGSLGAGGQYRVYARSSSDDDPRRADGTLVRSGWRRVPAGFRSDWGSAADGVTFQGDAYRASVRQARFGDIALEGANVLARLSRPLANGSSLSLQGYWDYTGRDWPGTIVEHINTADVQAQHAIELGESHRIVWGGGYRLAADRVQGVPLLAFKPAALDMHWANLFAQDQVALGERLQLTAGLKLEDNNYTGLELLPTLRLGWKWGQDSLLWTALSRSVRAPSRVDRDLYSPANPPLVGGVPQYGLSGGDQFVSEVAKVLELGYRANPTPSVSYSATAFLSRYGKLRTVEPNPNGTGLVLANKARGEVRGIEMWGNWQAAKAWRMSAGVVVQHVDVDLLAGSRDTSTAKVMADPRNYWNLRSAFELSPDQQLDLMLRHVGKLGQPAVPAYTTLDIRYGWHLYPGLELSLLARNLFDRRHAEFSAAPLRSEYERSLQIKLLWRL